MQDLHSSALPHTVQVGVHAATSCVNPTTTNAVRSEHRTTPTHGVHAPHITVDNNALHTVHRKQRKKPYKPYPSTLTKRATNLYTTIAWPHFQTCKPSEACGGVHCKDCCGRMPKSCSWCFWLSICCRRPHYIYFVCLDVRYSTAELVFYLDSPLSHRIRARVCVDVWVWVWMWVGDVGVAGRSRSSVSALNL